MNGRGEGVWGHAYAIEWGHAYAIQQWGYRLFFLGRVPSLGRWQAVVVMRG